MQDPEDKVFLPSKDYSSIVDDPSIGAVLCGFDMSISTSFPTLLFPPLPNTLPASFLCVSYSTPDYKKYAKAFTYIRNNPGCHFILTNADPTFPNGGALYPGSGAMSAPLRFALKQEPTIVGKPNRHMMDTIMAA